MRMTRVDELFSARVGARAAALVRIGIGVAAVLKAIQIGPLLARLDDPAVLRMPYVGGLPSVVDLPAVLVVAVWVAAAVAFAVGLRTGLSGAVLTLTLAAILFGDQQLYSNHLYLLLLLTGLLTLARSGSALSIDALPAGETDVPAWPLVLLRLQVSIVYLFAALSKVNPLFLAGTVVSTTLRRDGPLAVPLEWRTFEVMAVLSILAILTELFLAIALWLPRWRRLAFVVGTGLHVGIAIWFIPTGQLVIFSVIILSPYLLFLDAPRRGTAVVWDDSCGFCAGWVRLFRRLDWLQALRFVPSSDRAELERLGVDREEADRALQLVGRRRRRGRGFAAVVGVAELLPISFLWAPLLRLPPIAAVGERVYRRVAARRRCALPRPAEGGT